MKSCGHLDLDIVRTFSPKNYSEFWYLLWRRELYVNIFEQTHVGFKKYRQYFYLKTGYSEAVVHVCHPA